MPYFLELEKKIMGFRKLKCKAHSRTELCNKKSISRSNGLLVESESGRPIRIATFNIAMFFLSPAVSKFDEWVVSNHEQGSNKKNPTKGDFSKSILKQSPLHASMHKAKNLFDSRILPRSNLKAEKEKNMKPLSDLAGALGMKYVFAESWALEYGTAILSKWPIKKWKVQKITYDDDFRCVFTQLKGEGLLSI
ncbi:hypothetical protein VNO77_44664 [Canavalia gladiata]|uniref:Uncharacterized protein n=1 Tax=Canavalia gladiata TaxID=3824 RepID=A0AAN9PQL8_CANGL